MIHLIIGTKAQLIKMYPLIKLLDEAGLEYNYIDTGQHEEITKRLRAQLRVKEPDYIFTKSKSNISTTLKGIFWIFSVFGKSLVSRKKIFKNDKGGLCLVHGDTVSTLLGMLMALFSRNHVVHVEAGFRTKKLFSPFPEEICRRVVDRFSKINFACSDEAFENLLKDKIKGENYNLKENTLFDIVQIAKDKESGVPLPDKYVLVSLHRYETIHSFSRMKFVAEVLKTLSQQYNIVWGLHEPTKNSLIRFKLYDELAANPSIQLRGLFDYFDFIPAIRNSLCLITDGGGPQDETRYLNIPCLLLRSETEKENYTNVCECDFEKEKVDYFMSHLDEFKSKDQEVQNSPSAIILDVLKRHSK